MNKPASAVTSIHMQADPGISGGAGLNEPAALQRTAAAISDAAAVLAKTNDGPSLDRLRAVRVQAVESLLAFTGPLGPALADSLNAIVHSCRTSGVLAFPRSTAEEHLFARSQSALTSASADRIAACAFAAALLACHPFELDVLPPLAAFPKALHAAWLSLLLQLPPAFAQNGEAGEFPEYLQRVCDQIEEHLRTTTEPVDDIGNAFFATSAFMQAYFNELNLRGLMRSRAAIVEHLVQRGGTVIDQLRVMTPCRDRPRIGFISLGVTDGTESSLLAAYMERLDRRRFDVRLYSMNVPSGRIGALCRAAAETYVQLATSPSVAVAQLRKENLDLAVFSANVTARAHPLAQVAVHRIAPIQATTGVSPVTTGLRNMDVMLSGIPNETEDSPEHYTEHLVLMPRAINCYPFQHVLEGLADPGPIARSAHNIPADAVVFFSAANFYKILPELSEQWLRILARVPNSYLILMPFNPNWSNAYPVVPFHERLRRQAAAAGVALNRLLIHSAVPTIAHLHRVMETADVYLDAFPFSGACSIYDALTVGLPVVARSGAVCRSRHSAAILEDAGLGDWAVHDEASYFERAVALGRDVAERRAQRARVDSCREAGLRLTDTAAFAAMLMPTLESLLNAWNERAETLSTMAPSALAQRIAALVPEAAEELGSFTDRDLVLQVVLPYLRHGGSQRLIDVGACVGAMTSPFLAEGWQAVMFEPDQRCHPSLASLAEAHPGQVRIEHAAVTADCDGRVLFHIAGAPGLSGMSCSPFAADIGTIDVRALALAPYIVRNGLFDVDFVKIDAEGHDFAILDGIDFGQIAPRLVMVEFGEQFSGQDRSAVEGVLRRMTGRGYGACVLCLRPLGDLARHDWRTGLLAIGIDAIPALPAGMPLFGNILFFRQDDHDFLPSLCDWLEQFEDRKRRGLSPLPRRMRMLSSA